MEVAQTKQDISWCHLPRQHTYADTSPTSSQLTKTHYTTFSNVTLQDICALCALNYHDGHFLMVRSTTKDRFQYQLICQLISQLNWFRLIGCLAFKMSENVEKYWLVSPTAQGDILTWLVLSTTRSIQFKNRKYSHLRSRAF